MGQHTYGPVPSRRLGRSLGVDLVPMKTCSLNCVYCQLGPTPETTAERADYVPVDEIVAEVRQVLAAGADPDYVTLGGSGEPTLHRSFGEIGGRLRDFTDVPLALLTNGTLFWIPEVRAACAPLDLILPSLDACDEETFRRVNRPHDSITLERLVSGLEALRDEFTGQIWLEVFVIEGMNAGDEQIAAIRDQIERIRPERIQLNTAVRPTAEQDVKAPRSERLEAICAMLGPRAEIIAPYTPSAETSGARARKEEVLAMLQRRPCTMADIADGLAIHRNEAIKYVQSLLNEGAIHVRQRLYDTFYEAAGS